MYTEEWLINSIKNQKDVNYLINALEDRGVNDISMFKSMEESEKSR
jgi:hypothetical protein